MVGAALAVLTLFTFEHPSHSSAQLGYRGTGQVYIVSNAARERMAALNQVPPPQEPAEKTGKKASEVYQNVQVLKDVDEGEFNRLMASITEWVAPEQGCAYCHGDSGNFAEDKLYTKVVARRMLQMTQYINAQYKSHVQETGVTCYTCHRGNPVPQNIWFHDGGQGIGNGRLTGRDAPARSVGLAALPYDPFTPYLEHDNNIRVVSTQALPSADGNKTSIQRTEWTYALMMHMSTALGVNCDYCHNTRAFSSWEQSSPRRVTAWHGIRMVRTLNQNYLVPVQATFPQNRLGPTGDGPKLNCATCHQGAFKPLYGASMVKD
ncbi:MAG: photosynthetic reaction center cytochrome PufC, partial [Gemmatimonadales bacterium]